MAASPSGLTLDTPLGPGLSSCLVPKIPLCTSSITSPSYLGQLRYFLAHLQVQVVGILHGDARLERRGGRGSGAVFARSGGRLASRAVVLLPTRTGRHLHDDALDFPFPAKRWVSIRENEPVYPLTGWGGRTGSGGGVLRHLKPWHETHPRTRALLARSPAKISGSFLRRSG